MVVGTHGFTRWGRRRRRVPSWFIPALGYTISAAALVWVYWGCRMEDGTAKLGCRRLAVGDVRMAADIATYFFQGWRWSLLLRPVATARILRQFRQLRRLVRQLRASSRTGEILRHAPPGALG